MKKVALLIVMAIVAGILAAACGAPSTPETIVQTVVVKETVEVEKEVVVTKEVEVEKEVIVTVEVPAAVEAEVEQPYAGEEVRVLLEDTAWHRNIENTVATFEEETGIDVTLEFLPEVQEREKVNLDLTTGAGTYDVFLTDEMYIQKFVKLGALEPLDQFLNDPAYTKAGEIHLEDYENSIREAATYDGELYALPWRVGATILIYRADLFDKYGVEVPTTFTEMMDAAEKIQMGLDTDGIEDIYPVTMRGMRGGGLNIYIFAGSVLPAWGGEWFDEEGNVVLDSPEAIDAARFYAEILQQYGPPGAVSMSWDDCWKLFQDGGAAMWIDSAVLGAYVMDPEQSSVADVTGFAPVPVGPAGTRHGALYEPAYIMSKTAKNKGAAWEFMKFAVGREQMLSDAIDAGNFEIASRWVVENDAFVEAYPYPELIDAYLEMRLVAREERPLIIEWPEVGDISGEVLQRIIAGEISPEDGMKEMTSRISEVMAE